MTAKRCGARQGAMSSAHAGLERRRLILRERCAHQRAELSEALGGIGERLEGIDRALLFVRRLRFTPALVGLAAAALGTLPMFRYVSRALGFVRVLRGLLPSRR